MKKDIQTKELEEKIEQIEKDYDGVIERLENSFIEPIETEALIEVLKKAKAWDIFRAKCSKGAKVASKNLSKKERIERAKKASDGKKKKKEQEIARRHANQVAKHRI